MPKIDISAAPVHTASSYPAPYDALMDKRAYVLLGDAGRLTQFGANITVLQPGGMSSLRHWHLNEDEFVMVTEGEVVLAEDTGETVMRAGEFAAFPAGVANGHHMLNRTDAEARFLVIGTRAPHEVCTYTEVDLRVEDIDGKGVFTRRDGSPLPEAG
jgi:uncharacterized cupin superfamily protein